MSGFDPSEYIRKAVQAKVTGGGNFIRDGIYKFGVRNLLIRKGHKSVHFIAEHEVLTSAPADIDGKPSTPNLPGTDANYVCDLASDSGPGNMKAYFLALLGLANGQVDEDKLNAMIKKIVNEDPNAKDGEGKSVPVQSARGMAIGDSTFRKLTKAKTVYVGNNWAHVSEVDGNDDKSVTERRIKYGGESAPK